jgi:hypothetical protein
MAYKLSRLALDSYDVLLNGVIIASLVHSGDTDNATWTAELLVDLPVGERPAPFTEVEHAFGSLRRPGSGLATLRSGMLTPTARSKDPHRC